MTYNRFQFVVTLQAYFLEREICFTIKHEQIKLHRDEWIKPQTVYVGM